MAIFTVSNSTQLLSALGSARSGDVVELEAGTYSPMTIRGLNLAGVVIESKNPAEKAILSNLQIHDTTGLTIRNLEFSFPTGSALSPFQIIRSQDIRVDNVHVHGTLDGDPRNDPINGLVIRWSKNITIENSEFQQLWNALAHLDNQGLTIRNNHFHDLQTDAIRGGGTSDVLIARNKFTDFYPVAGDHPDAIQFWTTNTTKAVSNIVITENEIFRGAGAPIQGIFFRDEVTTLNYENVTITNNLVIGGMYNGIMIDGGRNLTISGNTVVALPDMSSWIRLQNVSNVWLEGNQSNQYLHSLNVSRLYQSDNVTIARPTDGGLDALRRWREDSSITAEAPLKSYKPSVFLSPQAAAPEAEEEVYAGEDGLFSEPFLPVSDFGPLERLDRFERVGREVQGEVRNAESEAIRAHVESLRFAVEGPAAAPEVEPSLPSPLIEEPVGGGLEPVPAIGPEVFELPGTRPATPFDGDVNRAQVDMPGFILPGQFVLPGHFSGNSEFVF